MKLKFNYVSALIFHGIAISTLLMMNGFAVKMTQRTLICTDILIISSMLIEDRYIYSNNFSFLNISGDDSLSHKFKKEQFNVHFRYKNIESFYKFIHILDIFIIII